MTTVKKHATISDVAERAGVSVPTVSRVLNQVVPVSEKRRKRVLAAIEELDYRPSAAARTLASRRSRMLSIVTSNTSRYGYAETIRGIELAARAADYTVTISVVENDDPEVVRRAVTAAFSQSPEGVIVLTFDPAGDATLRSLPTSVPVVALSGARADGVPQVLIDESTAAEELVRGLLAMGHRTVHHITVPAVHGEDGRTTGWRAALLAAGAPVPAIIEATWDPQSGRAVGRELAADPQVTAVLCGNDEIALGLMRGLADGGRHVPQDISVAGFDDHPLSSLWVPSLTTVRQDFSELGARGVATLLAAMSDEADAGALHTLRPEVRWRESTAPPAGA